METAPAVAAGLADYPRDIRWIGELIDEHYRPFSREPASEASYVLLVEKASFSTITTAYSALKTRTLNTVIIA